jgi:hypothetical protein
MKTGRIHFARSAMLTEYLRYIWSRPVPARIPVQEIVLSLPPAVPVPIKGLTYRESVLDRNPIRRSSLAVRITGRGTLSSLFVAMWLVIGALPAPAGANRCPEMKLLKVANKFSPKTEASPALDG